jgi:hypothetical protein
MWNQVLKLRAFETETPNTLDYVFNSSAIIVSAALDENSEFPYGQRTYTRVGSLKPIFAVPSVGLTYGVPKQLHLRTNMIRFENPYGYSYTLELYIHLWTNKLDLIFYQEDQLLVP